MQCPYSSNRTNIFNDMSAAEAILMARAKLNVTQELRKYKTKTKLKIEQFKITQDILNAHIIKIIILCMVKSN